MSTVVDTVTEIVTPILEAENFELVEVEFTKEGQSWFLRVFIYNAIKQDPTIFGIDLEDCAFVSERLSDALDAMDPDPIPQAYFLEISSPGAERPLKKEADYEKALGAYIHVSFYQAVDGEKYYQDSYSLLMKNN